MKRKRKASPKRKPMTVYEMARSGGRARARNMTPEQRSAAARHAVTARWARWHAERDDEERAS